MHIYKHFTLYSKIWHCSIMHVLQFRFGAVWRRRSVAGHMSPDHRLCWMMFVTTKLDTSSSKSHSKEDVRRTCAPASQPTTAANATSLFAQLASTYITLADITTIQVSFKASVLHVYIGQSIFQQM